MSDKLSKTEIDKKMEDLEIWGIENEKLVTRIEFEDYKDAVFFANMVFSVAEEFFHHPEVKVEYGAVEIDLWSHEEDGLTDTDFDMAEEIEVRLGHFN